MEPKLKPLVRELIARHTYVLLYHDGRNTYWLMNHWRYLNPLQQAKRVLLGKNTKSKIGKQYLTEL